MLEAAVLKELGDEEVLRKNCFFGLVLALFGIATVASAETVFPPETVVATRGGASVTMGDIDATLMGALASQRANIMNSPKRIEELISRLLINRQIANEAKVKDYDKIPEFKRAVDLQAERLLTEQYLKALRDELDIGAVHTLALERYNVNPQAYALPGATSVRHVLIGGDTRGEGEALALAESVRAKALSGADFVELVLEYSDDSSKRKNQGLIDDAESDSIDPMFAEAVKAMHQAGDISPVIKTQFGYHIIQFVSRVAPTPRTFEQARDSIVKQLENSIRDKRVKDHVDQLKGMEIDADPDVVASLRTRYLPKPEAAAEEAPKKESGK